SLRDMNRSRELEALLDAGAVSLKIEGRLKDTAYVKNVVAYYRKQLDQIFRRRLEFQRASKGRVDIQFEPRPEASFNRGFTNYFLNDRTNDLCNPFTPKSMGEYVGYVKEIRQGAIIVAGLCSFSNGDGLCFIDKDGRLQGFRVNRVVNNKLYPQHMPTNLPDKTRLYRNQDQAMERLLGGKTAERKLPLHWVLKETPNGFSLNGVEFDCAHQLARSPQREQIERQLARLGDTPFEFDGVDIEMSADFFIPGSTLAEWRRTVVERLTVSSSESVLQKQPNKLSQPTNYFEGQHLTYAANVANRLAREFYRKHGAAQVDMAMEVAPQSVGPSPRLMTCRYCIRHQLGLCSKQGRLPYREPLFLRSSDGRMFRLKFDCQLCQMEVYAQ
ncbi:MAG: DUF3656 domain-containing protein, partial [Bacteroidaceae bacterium]|nr:DUF3656 domain-containing protein [Bacteroidaceae bacterium]